MSKETNNGQPIPKTQTWAPDFVAIGKAYGAGRNSSDEGSIRDAEAKGRRVLDKARDCWNLEQWRDKKIKPCPRCGSPYCSIKCHVCAIVNRVSKGWTSDAGREKFTSEWLAANALAIKNEKAARKANSLAKSRVSALAWNKANPEKVRARSLAWAKANPESRRIHRHNRRARERSSGGFLSKGLSKKLFDLQKGKCPCCGKPLGRSFHMDHIMPLALGGSNTDENIQLLHPSCNQSKNAKHPVDYMQSKGFLL